MHYYFIADLHLSEENPHLTQLFLHFMQQAKDAQAVYILGDLFDFWVGDDEHSLLIEQVKQAIKTLTDENVPCYFQHGNRDFLIGNTFAQETGMQLLPDYHLIEYKGKNILLCHGDTLCTDDFRYQQFRQRVHQKWIQRLFLALPLCVRVFIAQRIRQKSQRDKRSKSQQIMDVNPQFVAQKMTEFQADWLIHGHTHRQAVHFHPFLTGKPKAGFTRIVLGDWGETASILTLDETGYYFND